MVSIYETFFASSAFAELNFYWSRGLGLWTQSATSPNGIACMPVGKKMQSRSHPTKTIKESVKIWKPTRTSISSSLEVHLEESSTVFAATNEAVVHYLTVTGKYV